jgi:hypothetical protein
MSQRDPVTVPGNSELPRVPRRSNLCSPPKVTRPSRTSSTRTLPPNDSLITAPAGPRFAGQPPRRLVIRRGHESAAKRRRCEAGLHADPPEGDAADKVRRAEARQCH